MSKIFIVLFTVGLLATTCAALSCYQGVAYKGISLIMSMTCSDSSTIMCSNLTTPGQASIYACATSNWTSSSCVNFTNGSSACFCGSNSCNTPQYMSDAFAFSPSHPMFLLLVASVAILFTNKKRN